MSWDTVLVIGSDDVADSTLVDPIESRLLGDLIVILEDQVQLIRAFDASGFQEWTVGRPGQGPLEFAQASRIIVGPDGVLWVVDTRNKKVVRVDHDGVPLDEQYYRHLSPGSGLPVTVGGELLWQDASLDGVPFFTDRELRPGRLEPIPWNLPDDQAYPLDMRVVPAGFSGGWVVAQKVGREFAIGRGDSIRLFPYVEQRFHGYRPVRGGFDSEEQDSAYWSARSTEVVQDELHVLFGGRPKRRAHDSEPTELIDVYGLDGNYRRSYRLPFPAHFMNTMDGETFYLLTHSPDGVPMMVALRMVERPQW